MKIGRFFTLEASHQLPNEEIYGACSELHGHSYRLEVIVSGPINEHGWVIDFRMLKEVVDQTVIEVCDHKHLNNVYPGMIPTAENLAIRWANDVQRGLNEVNERVALFRLRVYETAKCFAQVNHDDLTV